LLYPFTSFAGTMLSNCLRSESDLTLALANLKRKKETNLAAQTQNLPHTNRVKKRERGERQNQQAGNAVSSPFFEPTVAGKRKGDGLAGSFSGTPGHYMPS
jgi:hypothetical protein